MKENMFSDNQSGFRPNHSTECLALLFLHILLLHNFRKYTHANILCPTENGDNYANIYMVFNSMRHAGICPRSTVIY